MEIRGYTSLPLTPSVIHFRKKYQPLSSVEEALFDVWNSCTQSNRLLLKLVSNIYITPKLIAHSPFCVKSEYKAFHVVYSSTMGSEKQENVGNKRGIRVTSSVSSRRRLQRKITMKCCRCALQYPNLVDREHDFTSSMAIHAVFIFLNPLMVDLLQVQYQTKTTSPFETHAPNIWIFFVATCVHCLGLALEIKVQSFCKVLSNLVLFSGALSSISLASVFLPHLVGWICLSLWTILPFSVGFPFVISFFKTLYFKLKHAMAFVAKKPAELVKCITTPQKIFLPH